MITRSALEAYVQAYLNCGSYNDYAPNGLQIEGRATIRRICTAVTASLDVINQAASQGADALLVHHGYFWRGEPSVLTGMRRQRIGQLIVNDMNLYAYHLPLDCHPVIGNNACLATLLNINEIQMHEVKKIPNLLWEGKLANPITASAFVAVLTKALDRKPTCVSGSTKPIQRLAWCSGAADDLIENAYALGVDAYISGEISERTYYQAEELGLHYFACGHHATERYGIQALGIHLATEFDLEHQFIDSDNPI